MVSSLDLQRINLRLQEIRGINQSFGGLHVVLVGDLVQLPPVMQLPIFKEPKLSSGKDKEKAQHHLNASAAGHDLYMNHFKSVTTLVENMRALHDRQFTENLQTIRSGKAPEAKRSFQDLQKRYFFGMSSEEAKRAAEEFKGAPIIVPTNSARHAFNRSRIIARASTDISSESINTLRVDAVLEKKNLTERMENYIRRLGDDDTERLPMRLYLQEGMAVMITYNQDCVCGLANGQLGTVTRIQFGEGTKWTVVSDDFMGGIPVKVADRLPEAIFVKVARPETVPDSQALRQMRQHYGLEPGTVPIFPYETDNCVIDLAHNHSVRAKVKQFPLVPAHAITIHKIQGQTLPKVILGSFKSGSSFASFSAIYVALSRTKKLDGLLLLEPFNDSLIERLRRPEELVKELQRLENLENITRTKFVRNRFT